MEFDHDNVRLYVGNEDRLSGLPDELIHQILSRMNTKLAVQTSLLSSRWKHCWKSVPCLAFNRQEFGNLPKFSKFVTKVLAQRNHQIEVSSVKLNFRGAATQGFVRKIAKYAFSHNVQELTVICSVDNYHDFPFCHFTSQSLKRFIFSGGYSQSCVTPKTPWNFPALTTLRLSKIIFSHDKTAPLDHFSKFVNLKNLTLESYSVLEDMDVFDIITPRLINLTLIWGRGPRVCINLIAPQLENLTVIDCSVKSLNAQPGLSSLCYRGDHPLQLSKDGFHSLNKASISLSFSRSKIPYKEEDARETIKMLQELQSVRFLTLNAYIVECLSLFPDLLPLHPSPFSNLISLNIKSIARKDANKIKMSAEAINFLLGNSPSATFITNQNHPGLLKIVPNLKIDLSL